MARSRGRKRGGVGGHAIDDVLPQGWSDLAKDLMSPESVRRFSAPVAPISPPLTASTGVRRPTGFGGYRAPSSASVRAPSVASIQLPSAVFPSSFFSFLPAVDRPPSAASTQSHSAAGVSSYVSLSASSDRPPTVACERPLSIADDRPPTATSTHSPSTDDANSYNSLSAADDHPPSVSGESPLLVTSDRPLSPLLVNHDRPPSPLLVTSDHIDPIPTSPLPSAARVCPPSVTSSRAPSVDSVHSSPVPVAGDHSPLVANWQSVSVASDCSSPVASDRSLAPDDPTAHVIIPSSLTDEESGGVSTPSSYEQISLSDRFWFDDGSVVLRLENTLYKVHRSLLEAQSSFFRKELAEKNQPEDICNIYTSCSTDDFELVLSFIYPTTYGPNAERSTSEWLRAFYASTSLDIPALRDAAIVALTPTLPALTRLQIGRKFDVPGWTLGAYRELCERGESLTLEEARELGFADVVRLARAREMIARGGVWAEVEEMFAADPEPDAGPEPKASEPKTEPETEPEPLTSAVGDPDGCGCQICTRHSVSMEALSLN